jgi:cytochrome c553
MTSARAALALVLLAAPVRAADPGHEFFEKSVRPVLVERCVSCHNADKAKGGLRLDSRDGVLKGGDSGPAVVPGKPADSLLVKALSHADTELKMPPAGKLPAAEVVALAKWVEIGMPWPDKLVLTSPNAIEKAAARHWAFQPIKRPEPPKPGHPPDLSSPARRNPIDVFIGAKLADKGLALSPRADKRTLIRRATFDLHGLPPTPDEIDAFLKDDAPDAYGKLLDRLLASPRYGERWARHWLDVARYADNKGYVFFEGKEYPWAWTYRDYVIKALNDDVPFDRFVTEQLAADLVPCGDQAALGFLTVGGHFMNNTHDIIDDRIDVVTRGLMGLTVTCARCHDHKFDPIPAADYYSLYGIFRSSTEPTVPPLAGPAPKEPEYQLYAAELAIREQKLVNFVTVRHKALVDGARSRAAEYLLAAHAARNQPPADDFMLIADASDLNPSMITRWRQFLADAKKRKHPAFRHWHAVAELSDAEFADKAPELLKGVEGANPLVAAAFALPPKSMKDVAATYGKLLADIDARAKAAGGANLPERAAEELRLILYGPTAPADAPLALDWGFLSLFPDRGTQAAYQKLLRELEVWLAKGPPRAMALHDSTRPYDPRVFERGNPGRPGDAVPRQSVRVSNPNRKPFVSGSGRLELAREIVSKDNPLTARVFVNRVWLHHFGRGLVGTPGDFGLRGDAPTHPALLDWLASEFASQGWGIKRLHKLIMTSAAYTQASLDRPDALTADPDNRLLWKQNRRRLEFEALHDATLAVSGQLDPKLGGPPVRLFSGSTRRAVYGYVDRLEFPSLLTTFDVPNPAGLSPERTSTTVAPQALFMMNGQFTRAAAKKLAALPAVQKLKDVERIDLLYRTVYGRPPTADETKLAVAFVSKGPDRWADLAHALLMTNEFCFVD